MSGQGANGRSQSLYRKYRPTTFGEEEFVGQNHVSRTLRNAVRHDRVAHAYLFCGPRGSGKTSSARLLAKAVNCEAPNPDDRPCNQCAPCRTINEGRATDIIEIDAASNRGIEDMRDLREKVKFSPAQLTKKFYIIDEVHQLTKEASNALLKTLEEPPPHVVFILATTDQEKVLDTISSRCQTFVFHRFPVDLIANHLRRICTNEGITADDAALVAIARASGGAMRDALGLLDQLSSYGDAEGGITADTVRQILGAGGGEQVLTLVDAIMAGDAAAGLRAINATIDDGADSRQFAGQIVEYLRALLHAAASPNRALDEEVDTPVAPEHIAGFTLGEIAALVKRFSQVDYGIRHSAYGHLPLELCLIDAVLARTGEGPAATIAVAATPRPAATPPRALPSRPTPGRPPVAEPPAERPAPPERLPTPIRPDATGPRAVPTPEGAPPVERPAVPPPPIPRAPADQPRPIVALPPTPPPVAPPAPVATPPAQEATAALPDIPLERLHELWPRIRQGVRALNRRIEALLASTDPYMVTDGTLTLVAAYDFHRNGLNKDDTKRVIEEVLAQVLGGPYSLACITQAEVADHPVPTPSPAPPRTLREEPPPVAVVPTVTAAATTAPTAPPRQAAPPPPPEPEMPDDEPPWDMQPPEPEVLPETRRSAPTPSPRPTPQAHRESESPRAEYSPPSIAGADDRYITAIKNIFNAVEVKV
ncbi:MAG TPA: DNA polymerase III subunit gamma/tau [Thermomicrobiales bacterium]|jgi:DNA polymerase-3 subunit gamma/tau